MSRATLRTGSLVLVWLATVVGGHVLLVDYSTRPAPTSRLRASWPGESGLALDAMRPTLVMFLHPRCPCSRSSVSELARILARAPGAIAHAVFFTPEGSAESWAQGDLEESARAIPGLQVHTDPGGRVARSFGAVSSGECAVYSNRGELLFEGGVTASRGHEGDNLGSLAVTKLLQRSPCKTSRTPVFGCSLREPDAEPRLAGSERISRSLP